MSRILTKLIQEHITLNSTVFQYDNQTCIEIYKTSIFGFNNKAYLPIANKLYTLCKSSGIPIISYKDNRVCIPTDQVETLIGYIRMGG